MPPQVTSQASTGDRLPTISGLSEPGSTVTIAVNLDNDSTPDVTFTTTTDRTGNWSIDTRTATPTNGAMPAGGIATGTQIGVTAVARDAAGNTSQIAQYTLIIAYTYFFPFMAN